MENVMQPIPMQIVFRDVESSPAVEEKIRTLGSKLSRHFDKILKCHVVVESPHRHQSKGRLYHIRIELSVPNTELVVSKDHSDQHAHEDIYVAIRDAFNAMKRQLQDYAAKQSGG